jgi:23S rRNA (uracil1939-C5)-methyltransferase
MSATSNDGTEDIVRIAARGDGMTASGRAVPLAAPGDRVTAAGEILPGPHHATPPCRHFPRCGGCQLQHVDDVAYAAWMVERVHGALAAHGLTAGEVRPPHLSPPRSRRRATLKAQRIGGAILLGFNEGRSHRIIDMRQCEILDPALFALVAPLRRLLNALLGRRGTASVALTLADQGVDVLIDGVMAEGLAAHDALLDFAGGNGVARLAIDSGDGPEDRWAPEPVTITLGGVPVPLPHAAFLQATADGQAALVAAVRGIAGDARAITDLFSGLGTFSLALAGGEGRTVTAVEAARAAIYAQQRAAQLHHRPVRALHRDLYRRPMTAAELAGQDLVVIDPPRAGAEEQAQALAGSTVPRIAYVSCNPASFARDCALLAAGGYRVAWVRPVGQFRWSTHMELVADIVRD